MLKYELKRAESILIIEPAGPLQSQDFERLDREVDPYIGESGKLGGLMIYTQSFPGWDGFAAFLSHLRFVKGHVQKIRRVAVVTDSALLSILPQVGNYFVKAEVKHFAYGDRETALEWLKAVTRS